MLSDKRKVVHGGDRYRNRVRLDFSVNTNPLGVPEPVMEAMQQSLQRNMYYPDIEASALRESIATLHHVTAQQVVCGNGASELFMAIMHALLPRKVVLPVPSFYGYEHALLAVSSDIQYVSLKSENGFAIGDTLINQLSDEVDLVILANPNNPTGVLTSKEDVQKLLEACKRHDIWLLVDECFMDFCTVNESVISLLESYDRLMVVRAFTKIYAIAGVRLGYMISANNELLCRVRRQLPEWNVSVMAQEAGRVCMQCKDFVASTISYVARERAYMKEKLETLNMTVWDGKANFLLVYSELDLYEKLLSQGILIRDCSDFAGLSKGYFRIAIRTHKENEELIKEIAEIESRSGTYIAK